MLLCGPGGRYITGQSIHVSGGIICRDALQLGSSDRNCRARSAPATWPPAVVAGG